MAETSPRWLIPAEAGETPTRRAFHLLGSFLEDDQKAMAERYGGIVHEAPGRLYWIPLDGAPKCAFLDEGRIESYCVAPTKGEDTGPMPPADVALTYLLWIKTDPDGFHEEAVVLRTTEMTCDPDRETVLDLFAGRVPAPRRRRRARERTTIGRPALSLGIAPGRSIDVADLQSFLQRNGRTLPPRVAIRLERLLGGSSGSVIR